MGSARRGIDILGIGEPLIEMVRLADPIDGRPAYVQGFGGDTSTAIIAAARQGAETGYISAVGEDMFGEALRTLWSREGVDYSHVRTRGDSFTGVCFIDPDPAGRRFTYARKASAASAYCSADLPRDAIEAAKVLHLSGITLAISRSMRDAAIAAADLAREAGTLVSFDLNHRPKLWSASEAVSVVETFLPYVDIAFVSDDETEQLFGASTPDGVADLFRTTKAKMVVFKKGADGAVLLRPGSQVEIPPAPSKPIDSSGAGDAFAGSFLAWYLETGDPLLAAGKAAEVAAATVSGLGAVEPIPRR